MTGDKVAMEAILEKPSKRVHMCKSVGSQEVMSKTVRNRRFRKVDQSTCSSPRIICILTMIIIVQVVGLVFLIYDKFRSEAENKLKITENSKNDKNGLVNAVRETLNHLQETEYVTESTSVENQTETIWDYFTEKDYIYESDFESNNLTEKYTSAGPWDMYDIKPRCFSMCEPPELFFREDKLIKTVVVHDGSYPVRYYMFLFPDQPTFDSNLGPPLLLSPLIRAGKIEEARNRSLVRNLPLPRDLVSYSGFITVNETANSNLFFWFFPAENGNVSAPVILWLQGGPGSSSMYGLLKEHGPFLADVDKNGHPFVKHNPYRWSADHNVLYVDNPVGTGFSFTDDPTAYPKIVEESTDDLFIFLQQFYTLFPEYQQSNFFPFGESYAGKYVPTLAFKIHNENIASINRSSNPENWVKINLAGMGIGNGWMSPLDQGKYASYLFFHGLIDKHQYRELDKIDGKILKIIEEGNWLEAWKVSDEQLNFILTALNYSNLYDISKDQYRPSTMNFWSWLNTPTVRKSIHVGSREFSDGLKVYMSMVEDTMRSVKPYLEEILKHYRVVNYHGALDIICHYPGTEDMYSKTKWPGHKQFMESHRRGWWVHNSDTNVQELAGFVKKGGNLRLVLLRNAGHSVPINQPQWALRLLEDFVGDRL